jgi:hypothetical protein
VSFDMLTSNISYIKSGQSLMISRNICVDNKTLSTGFVGG